MKKENGVRVFPTSFFRTGVSRMSFYGTHFPQNPGHPGNYGLDDKPFWVIGQECL